MPKGFKGFQKGKAGFWTGKKMPREAVEKMRQKKLGKKLSIDFHRKYGQLNNTKEQMDEFIKNDLAEQGKLK